MNKNNEVLINFKVSKKMHADYKKACQAKMYTMRAPLLRAMASIIDEAKKK